MVTPEHIAPLHAGSAHALALSRPREVQVRTRQPRRLAAGDSVMPSHNKRIQEDRWPGLSATQAVCQSTISLVESHRQSHVSCHICHRCTGSFTSGVPFSTWLVRSVKTYIGLCPDSAMNGIAAARSLLAHQPKTCACHGKDHLNPM